MNRWSISITRGGIVKELMISTEPTPSFLFGDVGSVSQLPVSSSRTIKIASTPESDSFFEFFKEFNVVTDIARQNLDASLLYAGEPFIENGKIRKLKYTGGSYSLIIAGDNAKLADLVDADLSALDWSSYKIDYKATAQSATYDPLTDDLLYIRNRFNKAGDTLLTSEWNLPLVSLRLLYEQILAQNGLTSNILSNSTNFEALDEFNRQFVQLTTREIEGTTLVSGIIGPYEVPKEWVSAQVAFAPEAPDYSSSNPDFWTIETKTFNYTDLASTLVNEQVMTLASGANTVTFNAVSTPIATVPAGCRVEIAHYKTEGATATPFAVKLLDASITATQTVEFNTYVEVGDYFVLLAIRTNNDNFTIRFDIDGSILETEFVYDKGEYLLSGNTPKIKQFDVIKYIINKYALIIDYDQLNNELVFYDYAHLLAAHNAGNSVDLTNVLVNASEIDIDFNGDLATNNYLTFSNDEAIKENGGRGVYTLNSQNCELERTVFKSVFSFSNEYSGFAVLPYVEQEEPDTTPNLFKLVEIKDRIVTIDNSILTCNATMDEIDFQHSIATYYQHFDASNSDLKLLTISVVLTSSQLRKLKQIDKLPVFINYNDGKKQISGVFKLNKIDRWSDKRATSLILKRVV